LVRLRLKSDRHLHDTTGLRRLDDRIGHAQILQAVAAR
jgi:hypothetical protein